MSATTTEEIRDAAGKLAAIRVTVYDDLGRANFADVPIDHAIGVDIQTVVAAVQSRVAAIVAAKSAGPGQVLQAAEVLTIAKSKGSKK